jgi:hypothetical protein
LTNYNYVTLCKTACVLHDKAGITSRSIHSKPKGPFVDSGERNPIYAAYYAINLIVSPTDKLSHLIIGYCVGKCFADSDYVNHAAASWIALSQGIG